MLEVLGGSSNQYGSEWPGPYPTFINENAQVSIVTSTNGPGSKGYDTLLRDIQGSTIKVLERKQFPQRVGRERNNIIPLYIIYTEAKKP